MNLKQLDLKLQLLSGEPIKVDDRVGSIKPLTVRQIIGYGYSEYLKVLNMLSVNAEDLFENDSKSQRLKLNLFDILTDYGGEETHVELEKSLSLFFQEEVKVFQEAGVIAIGGSDNPRIIDRENFDNVREVIKLQNCIKKVSDDEEDSSEASDKAKEIMEKLKKNREITSKLKEEDGESDLDLSDMLSAISSKSNSLNKLSVFDLTLFQLYDEFKRLELVDQYFINIKSMLAGAKNIKLKHWSSKLD